MSGDHNTGWRKRKIALDKKAENAHELGLDYEPSKTVMDMAREAGFVTLSINEDTWGPYLERFAALVQEQYAEMHTPKWSPKIQQLFNKDGVLESQTIQYAPQSIPVPYPAQRKPLTDAEIQSIHDTYHKRTEQNFCPRCGKRTADLTTIHTCTPPQENL